jgi:sugar lactone lactonase YvrE
MSKVFFGPRASMTDRFLGFARLKAAAVTLGWICLLLGAGTQQACASTTVVAGFNRDGLPDIAVVNGHDNNVSVLLTQWTGVRSATVGAISPVGTGTHEVGASYAGDPETGLIEPVGTTSATQTATITLTASGTLGTIAVLTQGAPNLDFNFVPGGSCTPGIPYSTGQTCTVQYTFTPTHPGPRYGGITLTTSSGSLLANSYISGAGTGPQVTYRPGTQTTLASGFDQPNGTAVDGNGNVFVADEGNNAVKEILAAGGYTTVNTLGRGFANPIGVAVDGGGNVFVADANHHAVKEILAAGGYTTINTLFTGTNLIEPIFLVVDGIGNIFFSEGNTHVVMEILAAGGYTTVNTIYNVPPSSPSGLALDGSGNLYISDLNNTVVTELLSTGGYTTAIALGGDIQSGYGIAVDASGAVYVAEPLVVNGDVKRIPPGCVTASCVVTLALNLSHPAGLAMDGSGNIYIGDQGNNRVVKLDYTHPPSLSFATTAVGSTSSDSPQTVTLTNSGNTNLSVTVPSTGNNPTITPGFTIGGSSTCPRLSPNSSVAMLAPGVTCTDVISFVPVAPGLDSGKLITTDDNLNAPGATQIILLNGTGTGVPPTVTSISPSSGPTAGGTVVMITGTNLLSASTVNFGGTAATSFTVNSATSITAISPAGTSTVDVTVTTSSGVSAPNASDQFTYVPPQPQTITFVQSPTAYAGTSVSLIATGGASGNPVIFSVVSGPASVSGVNGSTLTFTRQGTVVVAANQAGNASYSPASTVMNTIAVTTLTEPVGTTSPAVTTLVTLGTAGTLAAINVLTQGKADLDFHSVAGGTCAIGTTYAAGQTCTVEFSFTPTHPGLRYGGVTLTTSSGTALANSYIYGIGVGPQIIWTPGTQSLLGSGLNTPSGVAVDGSGNVFVSDEMNNAVEEISAADGSTRTLGTFALPDDIAVDGSGNVFVISNRTTLSEILAVNGTIPASPTIFTLSTAFLSLNGMKVDGNGNVFLASSFFDGEDSAVQEVLAVNGSIPASPTILTLVSGIGGPTGVAVDASGNVFFSDELNGAVHEALAVNGSIPASPTVVTLANGLTEPSNVALDGSGNVFVPEIGPNAVQEILAVNGTIPTSPTILTLGTGITSPEGLFVDANGNVFVADAALTQIVKLDYADPPSLTFASTPVGSTSTDSPQTVTITNDGNASLTLPPPSAGNNPSITPGFTIGNSSTCPQLTATSSPATLPTGASCTDVISFTPVAPGLDSGALITTDNNLNVAGANQIVPLNGFGIAPSVTTLTVSPNPALFGTAVIMTATVAAASSSPTTPTGTVTFFDNGTAIGTQTLAGGVATLTSSSLPVGADTITCTYSGNSNFTSSTCNAVVVHITPDPSALTIATSINPSPALTPVAFTAHFTINGKPAGAGNAVTFSVTPQSGAPTLSFPATTDATGAAAFTPSGLYPGTYLVSVAYPATTNVLASSAGPITETVNLNPTATTLTASPTPGFQNQPVTFVATVTALAGTAPPNGTVTLIDGTTTIATIPAVLGNGAFSTATFTFSTSVLGSHSFTAIYTPLAGNSGIAVAGIPFGTSGGALSFLASQSAALSLTILPQDFSLTANPPSITIETQHHGTMQLTLTSIGGFTGPITLTCGTALPPWVTCEPPTSPTHLAANATTPVNLTLDTDQLLGFLSYAKPQAPPSHTSTLSRIAIAILLPLTLFGLGRRRKPLRSLLMTASLAILLNALTACGGNKYPNHTPPGVYSIPVTATGTAVGSSTPTTHTLNITLTVTP